MSQSQLAEPASTQTISAKALNVPPEMILQIAAGMEEPFVIAERFGFTQQQFAALAQWPQFRQQVEQKKAELQASGVTFRMKQAFFAEDLSQDIYVLAKSNETTLPQKLDAFRTFAKLADLEPRPTDQRAAAGSGFSIKIIFNDKAANKPEAVIDVTPTPTDPIDDLHDDVRAAAEPAGLPAK